MKILYIAPFRDFSGYAAASRGYLNALDQAGADIVARAIRYDRADKGTEYQPTELESELLKKPLEDIDVVIQHSTPNELRPVEGKTNIAVVAWETTRIPDYWAESLNKFDAVITFCDASVKAFTDCGVTVPVSKIPHTFDIPSYSLDGIESIVSEQAPDLMKERFVFYNISQFSVKKGLDVLLRAYYAQFHGKGDDVLLVLKTYIDMANRGDERKKLQQYIEGVKGAMRLPVEGYPPVMVVTNTVSEEKMKRIHATGSCYVCSSRAEGWCIPAFEALAYGNKLVTTAWGGMGEFSVNEALEPKHNVYLVDHSLEPLVGQNHSDPDLYTSRDFIAEPSVSSMMRAMQDAMDSDPDLQTNATRHEEMMEFDYSQVGPKMLDVITQTANKTEEVNV